jgi:hypothetical protein
MSPTTTSGRSADPGFLSRTGQPTKAAPCPARTSTNNPKKPFVIGGEYEVANLKVMDAVEAMQYRGYLAQQLRDVPRARRSGLCSAGPTDHETTR